MADANRTQPSLGIDAEFAQVFIRRACRLYAREPLALALQQPSHELESTTVDLCLSAFSWAQFRLRQGAIKGQTLLDLRGDTADRDFRGIRRPSWLLSTDC